MKRICILFLAALALLMTACGNTGDAEIIYGDSDIYSQSDMDSAIRLIKREFSGWSGCELHKIEYAGDECNSEENIKWLNELAEANGIKAELTQCIQFVSEFHSPKNGGGAWNPDEEYTGWQWNLARVEGGKWYLLTWGY